MALAAPGFFGKVPARGDFVCRRVLPAVAAPWDAWLEMLTMAVRAEAGAAWPEAWLTAPLWHFALGAGLLEASGTAGVLVASADRVGRMFPFTIIGSASGIPDEAWCDACESLALEALEDRFDPDTLDDSLQRLGAPAPGAPIEPGLSLWRCRGSDRVGPTSRMRAGLPVREDAAAMVLGGHDAAGLEMGLG